jgi:hypothetical protein
MPIYQDVSGALVLRFGVGDIVIARGTGDDSGITDEIVFMPSEAKPLGTVAENIDGRYSDEVGAACRMVFTRAESVDYVIEILTKIRASLADASA